METLVSSTSLPASEGKGRRRKPRKLAEGRVETEGKGHRRKVRKLAGEHGEAEGKGRRRKVRKLGGGPAVDSHGNSEPPVTDPQQEDPNQMGVGGSEDQLIGAGETQHPSVYITVNRGRWFSCTGRYYPLHKVKVASDDVSTSRGAPVASHVTTMTSDIGFKTFVSVRSRWFVGVGGNPGHTVIFDTKTAEVISGPKPVTPKLCPVVTTVGYRVYALSVTAQFEEGPDFTPWFEVLDLSKAMDTKGNLNLCLLKHCSWEALPSPPFFACKLPTAEDCVMPHSITVVSYVVVEHYIVLSVIGEPKPHGFIRSRPHMATYAFDTRSEEWHKVDDTCLPFYGAATKLGHSSRIFLGLCQKNRPVNAYRICVSPSGGSSAMAGLSNLSGKDGAPKLSITVFPVETKALEEIRPERACYNLSFNGTRFSTLLDVLGNGGCHMKFCKEDIDEFYSVMLNAKLKTNRIENESLALLETEDEEKLLAVKPEIVVSSKPEQTFGICRAPAPGFCPTPDAFVAS
ncbi:hypothetical protein HU200_034331 [Digitaria exilis]|uniref:Uncharacterized protein n=1 Tax=Digitaria exilis TaxID=1010633 RepID=A0A835BTZ6_9POAL|nr:hypothetical protein HU200_034331 [Digitaria exilis]